MIPALIPAAIGAAQLIGGAISRFSSKRPKREIPRAAREALAVSQIQAASPYAPGYGQAREGVEIASANALAAAQASGNPAAAIQGIVGQQQRANQDLVGQNLQYQSGAQQRLQGALGVMAEEEDRQFQINEFAPYADKVRLGEDMIGAGATNINSSANMLFAADQMGLLNFGKKKERPGMTGALMQLGQSAAGAMGQNSQESQPSTPFNLPESPQEFLRFTEMIKNIPRSIYLP